MHHCPAEQDRDNDGGEKDQRLVAGPLRRDRRQHPPALLVQFLAEAGTQQLARGGIVVLTSHQAIPMDDSAAEAVTVAL